MTTVPTQSPPPTLDLAAIDARKVRKRVPIVRIVVGAILALIAAQLGVFLALSPQLQWDVFFRYLFDPEILSGLAVTLTLAVVAQVFGTILGTVFAAFRLSAFRPLQWSGWSYVTFFRTPPALVQLIFWFNIAYLVPVLEFRLPFGPVLGAWETNQVVTPVVAAVLGLSLIQGAYMTEIVRSGIMSVGIGQREAAKAAGYAPWQAFSRIIFPQAVRVIVPPTGSQFIHVVHGTALVSVIAVGDVLFSVQRIYNRTFEIIPLLLVATFWYLVIVLALNYVQQWLELRYGRGHSRDAAPVKQGAARRQEAAG
ncbi:amino acid ABC transporter permease [Pseudonocardia sp. DLS-67]